MYLFVYESLSAGGLGDHPPASLRAEGWAMLSAAVADFALVASVASLLSPDLPEIPGVRCRRTASADEPRHFLDAIDDCDAALVIAPEFDDILAQRAEQVLTRGKRLLGCRPNGVRLAADKLALARHWQTHGVPTPATNRATPQPPPVFPVILKPRDGAGSQATRLVADPASWEREFAAVRAEWPGHEFIVQPYHPGTACSVAFLIGPRQSLALAPTEQVLSTDGRFQYHGGRLPLAPDHSRRALDLASKALAGIDGLAGFVGVDLVLAGDGLDVCIEINPRLTTSYIGLRRLCRDNLADGWLRVLNGERDVRLSWRDEPIRFFADGQMACGRPSPP
jgi:predicted ATP-grasp superfamily ATP-dependent carboligase